MAKDKPFKTKGVPNRHLHARTTFLFQAAAYLTLHAGSAPASTTGTEELQAAAADVPCARSTARNTSGLAMELGSHMNMVSRKGQVRLSADVKRSMCKKCDMVLIPGRTSTQRIENASKGGKKPWADILIVECILCGSNKRFPVGAKRQARKNQRGMQNNGD